MTSIHFVVHPLPGTEDQLNDRYFVAARCKVRINSVSVYSLCRMLCAVVFVVGVDSVMCMHWGLNDLNDTPWVKTRPGILNNPR